MAWGAGGEVGRSSAGAACGLGAGVPGLAVAGGLGSVGVPSLLQGGPRRGAHAGSSLGTLVAAGQGQSVAGLILACAHVVGDAHVGAQAILPLAALVTQTPIAIVVEDAVTAITVRATDLKVSQWAASAGPLIVLGAQAPADRRPIAAGHRAHRRCHTLIPISFMMTSSPTVGADSRSGHSHTARTPGKRPSPCPYDPHVGDVEFGPFFFSIFVRQELTFVFSRQVIV